MHYYYSYFTHKATEVKTMGLTSYKVEGQKSSYPILPQ